MCAKLAFDHDVFGTTSEHYLHVPPDDFCSGYLWLSILMGTIFNFCHRSARRCATDVAKDQGHHEEIATTFGCGSRWHDEASGLRSACSSVAVEVSGECVIRFLCLLKWARRLNGMFICHDCQTFRDPREFL